MAALNEIARELIDEHSNLRRLADDIQAALILAEGSGAAAALLLIRLGALAEALHVHNEHEEQLLGVALPTVDAWGPVRRTRMDEHHRAAHAALSEGLRAARAASSYAVAAAATTDALAALAAHMAEEERDYLNADVLSDEVVVIDQSDG